MHPEQETVIGVKYGEWGREKYGTAKGKVDAVEVRSPHSSCANVCKLASPLHSPMTVRQGPSQGVGFSRRVATNRHAFLQVSLASRRM